MSKLHPIQAFTPFSANPAEYHKIGADVKRGDPRKIMSFSELKEFSLCPLKWLSFSRREQTEFLTFGSLHDCVVLTPDKFEHQFAVSPETYMSTKDGEKPWTYQANTCKEWRRTRLAAGLQVATPSEASDAWAASATLKKDERLNHLVSGAKKQVQVCVEWHDDNGIVVPIKCLIDLVPSAPFGAMLGDLKSTNDASPRAWVKTIFNFRYHWQAALYLDAWNVATGESRVEFAHVVQESSAPFAVARRLLSTEFIELGRNEYRHAFREYCQCLESGFWPGYDDRDSADTIIDGWRVSEPEMWMIKDLATV